MSEVLEQKIIQLEKESGYFSKLVSDKRFLLLVFVIILLMALPILINGGLKMLSSPIFFILGILTVIFVAFGIYVGTSSRTIIFDEEELKLRFGIFTQSCLWKDMSSVSINIDPLTRKEQIQLNQREKKSWAILNIDYTSDSWANAKRLIIQYAKEHNIEVGDRL